MPKKAQKAQAVSAHALEAFKAAEAAEAEREQGKYWEFLNVLMRNQSELSVEKLKGYATEVSLDRALFDSALESGKFADAVKRDIEDGMRLRINATPTIFINGRQVTARSYEELKVSVDAAFKAQDNATFISPKKYLIPVFRIVSRKDKERGVHPLSK